MGRGERNHMKKENNFLDLMGEIDEKNGIDRSLSFWIGSSIKKRDTGSGI